MADKITWVSKTSPNDDLETNDGTLTEKYISPELRQKLIDNLRLKED